VITNKNGLCANKRIAVITDKGVRGLGLIDAGLEALRSAGYDVLVFDDVVADPPEEIVVKGGEAVKAFKAGLVIGFGGGSPMDTAKVIAHLAGCDQPIQHQVQARKSLMSPLSQQEKPPRKA